MLSKIAGYADFAKAAEEKTTDIIQVGLSKRFHKVNAQDMFVKAGDTKSNLMQFLDPKELADAKKLLKKPTGEGFDVMLKQECEALKNKAQ